MQSEVEVNKIVIFGGTGYIGKFLVEASVKLGHPTYVYARPITQHSNSTKIQVHNHFNSLGVTIIQGELDEHEKIVALLSEVDIVISALAYPQVMEQIKILDAIKAAGNIKRFLPSDFGCEEDRASPLPPFEKFLEKKRKIRRAVEAYGIPFTYVAANCYGAYFVNLLLRPYDQPPAEEVTVFGTGEAKVVLNYEEDIGMYTIKVANDPRACNKVVHFRMPKTIVTQLELISLWENKTGRTFNKIYVSEEDLVERTQSLSEPENIPMAILHSIFVKGDLVSYELGEDDLEASNLYPDYDYTTIDGLLHLFLLSKAPKPIIAAFQ